MVDNFQAKYSALDIPYPSDQGTLAGNVFSFSSENFNFEFSAIYAQGAEQKAAAAAFCAASKARIADLQAELVKWEAMKPVEEMNLEEALDAGLIGTTIKGIVNPEVPSMWPHTEVIIFSFL